MRRTRLLVLLAFCVALGVAWMAYLRSAQRGASDETPGSRPAERSSAPTTPRPRGESAVDAPAPSHPAAPSVAATEAAAAGPAAAMSAGVDADARPAPAPERAPEDARPAARARTNPLAPPILAQDASAAGGSKAPRVFTFAGHGSNLDPALVIGPDEERLVLACCEGLTRIDPSTGEVGPGAAESWTVSPDGKTWTFTLRKAFWQQRVGTAIQQKEPVKASDFIYAWKRRLLEPSVHSPNAHMLDGLVGVRALSTEFPRGQALDAISTDLLTRIGGKDVKKSLKPDDVQEFLNNPDTLARGWLSELDCKEAKEILAWASNQPYAGAKAAQLCKVLQEHVAKCNAVFEEADPHVGVDRGFWAKGDQTLVLETPGPSPWLPSLLARAALVPVNEKMTDSQPPDRAFKFATNQVCNGAFVCATDFPKPGGGFGSATATKIFLYKNPAWWSAASVKSDKIVGLVDTGDDDVLLQYRNAACQWILADALSPEKARALRAAKAADWKPAKEIAAPDAKTYKELAPDGYEVASGRVFVLRFRCVPPLDKKEPRQALAALALAARATLMLKADGTAAPEATRRFVHPGTTGVADLPRKLDADPSKAAALYGKRRFSEGTWLSILVQGRDDEVAQAIRKAWPMTVIPDESADETHQSELEMYSFVHGGKWDALVETWSPDYDDPLAFLAPFTTGNPIGACKWSNPLYDALVEGAKDVASFKASPPKDAAAIPAIKAAIDRAGDAKGLEALRSTLLAEAEAILLEEAVVVPLWIPVDSGLRRSGVKGVHIGGRKRSILDPQYLTDLSYD